MWKKFHSRWKFARSFFFFFSFLKEKKKKGEGKCELWTVIKWNENIFLCVDSYYNGRYAADWHLLQNVTIYRIFWIDDSIDYFFFFFNRLLPWTNSQFSSAFICNALIYTNPYYGKAINKIAIAFYHMYPMCFLNGRQTNVTVFPIIRK